MGIKTIICMMICVGLFTFVYLAILEYKEFGSVSPPAPICSLLFFIWLVIVLAIPAERFERKKTEAEVEVFSIQPKIENGDTTYIIKYRTK